jgi:hypothetical protein
MDEITVSRLALLEKVRANRDAHRALFLKAQEGFRARVVEELDAMLRRRARGATCGWWSGSSRRRITPPTDRAIAMLDMHQRDELAAINATTFAQLVANEWAWFRQATATNTIYAAGSKLEAR